MMGRLDRMNGSHISLIGAAPAASSEPRPRTKPATTSAAAPSASSQDRGSRAATRRTGGTAASGVSIRDNQAQACSFGVCLAVIFLQPLAEPVDIDPDRGIIAIGPIIAKHIGGNIRLGGRRRFGPARSEIIEQFAKAPGVAKTARGANARNFGSECFTANRVRSRPCHHIARLKCPGKPHVTQCNAALP